MKGILFKPDMIKAIRDKRKTVTRRLAGLKEINECPDDWKLSGFNFGVVHFWNKNDVNMPAVRVKPREGGKYQVGETVYIKEAWAGAPWQDDLPPSEMSQEPGLLAYKACPEDINYCLAGKWRSPLFMPAWAARDFLKITDVRAERLQEITSEDCIAEGIAKEYRHIFFEKTSRHLIDEYKELWNSINKEHPWESNPWIFRYQFEEVTSEHKE